jgi:hypothetical protein
MLNQGILKGEVSLYSWPPVWLVWNKLYDNWQFLFLFAKQTNPNKSNRRSTVQWYCPLYCSVVWASLLLKWIFFENQWCLEWSTFLWYLWQTLSLQGWFQHLTKNSLISHSNDIPNLNFARSNSRHQGKTHESLNQGSLTEGKGIVRLTS